MNKKNSSFKFNKKTTKKLNDSVDMIKELADIKEDDSKEIKKIKNQIALLRITAITSLSLSNRSDARLEELERTLASLQKKEDFFKKC